MRNKTIDFSLEDGAIYLESAIKEPDLKSNVDVDCVVNKFILGDTLKTLKKLPKKSVDLLICDPPYNLNKSFGKNKFLAISSKDYIEYTKEWLSLCMPLLKDNASIYICCDWKCSNEIFTVLQENAIVLNRITWQREKGRGAKANWKNGMEDIWFASVTEDYYFNLSAVKQRRRVLAPYKDNGKPKDWTETPDGKYRDTCPSNFWDDISVPYWSMAENTAHPTQKPEKLIAKLILASSKQGDVVLDPFGGSGTTAVTANKLGRKFISIEQNPQYVAWSIKRLSDAERDKTIQGYEDGVFWERNTQLKLKSKQK